MGVLLWHSGLRIWSLMCLGSMLWHGFDFWPANFCMPREWSKMKNKIISMNFTIHFYIVQCHFKCKYENFPPHPHPFQPLLQHMEAPRPGVESKQQLGHSYNKARSLKYGITVGTPKSS